MNLICGGWILSKMSRRVEIIDSLRGFALFGVLVANIGVFTHDNFDYHGMVSTIYSQFILNNFYPMFAMLFGLSFYIFMSRPYNTGYIFCKRLFLLLVFGTLHMVFIWHLDILHAYALTGFLLIFFYKMNLSTLKIWLVIMFILDMLFASFLSDMILDQVPPPGSSIISSYDANTYLANLSITLENVRNIFIDALVDIPHHLFLFLLGLYVGKSGLVTRIEENIQNILKASWASLFLFVAFYMLRTILENFSWGIEYFISPLSNLFNLSLTIFYITMFVLLYYWNSNNYIFSRFGYIGKMTLTNYIAQSVLFLILFYEFNFGMYQEIPTAIIPLIAIPLYILQAEFSRLWLERYRQGPLESIWRYLTYLKVIIK